MGVKHENKTNGLLKYKTTAHEMKETGCQTFHSLKETHLLTKLWTRYHHVLHDSVHTFFLATFHLWVRWFECSKCTLTLAPCSWTLIGIYILRLIHIISIGDGVLSCVCARMAQIRQGIWLRYLVMPWLAIFLVYHKESYLFLYPLLEGSRNATRDWRLDKEGGLGDFIREVYYIPAIRFPFWPRRRPVSSIYVYAVAFACILARIFDRHPLPSMGSHAPDLFFSDPNTGLVAFRQG